MLVNKSLFGKKIVQPPYLKEGDKVAFVSPAYWLPGETITQAAEEVKKWGLRPVFGRNNNHQDVYAYAGTADERADDLRWALEQDDIKAIICTRGGYGSIHLLDRIPLSVFEEHPKWLIGLGDITSLNCAEVAAGVMSIYGPMSVDIAEKQGICVQLLHDILFGKVPQYVIPADKRNIPGHAEGILVGGNLSSYSALAGTEYNLAPGHDIILFMEEMEEALHDIDRLFYMLRLQKKFQRIKGVILGEFIAIQHDLQFDSAEQMIIQHLRRFNIPVCCGFPIGGNNCLPLIEGAQTSLDIDTTNAVLTFDMEGEQTPIHINTLNIPLFK
ncbi:MAG: LD-carboxypeptidase [Prevotella sp.]|nr:LD-carboxypeptidase [Prevotella sp.]